MACAKWWGGSGWLGGRSASNGSAFHGGGVQRRGISRLQFGLHDDAEEGRDFVVLEVELLEGGLDAKVLEGGEEVVLEVPARGARK